MLYRSREVVAEELMQARRVVESFDDFGPRRGRMPSYQAAVARCRALENEMDGVLRGPVHRVAVERIRAQLLNGA